MGPSDDIAGTETFSVGRVEFVPGYDRPSVPGSFTLQKSPAMLQGYRELANRVRGGRIFELGIAQGGSVALLALLADPARLVSVELNPDPVGPLLQMIEDHGLAGRVSPHFGVDQSDRTRIAEIARTEFGGAPIDLVIDDASHLYEPTLASFEVLFPLVRPGGQYVIEDWTWIHLLAQTISEALSNPADPRHAAAVRIRDEATAAPLADIPLSRIAVEAMLARSTSAEVVVDVAVSGNWITITRGPAELQVGEFRLADHYQDHFGYLTATSPPRSSS